MSGFKTTDYEELKKNYTFLPPPKAPAADKTNSTWQQRMAENYSDQLYKEYGIIDFSAIIPYILSAPASSSAPLPSPQLGLRWRTASEVSNGKGFKTCGNRRCPALTSGLGLPPLSAGLAFGGEVPGRTTGGGQLLSYEVPFAYVEGGEKKRALVKVR